MNATAPPRAGRREWIGVAALALPCMLVVMDLSVLFLAVPSLTADLRPSSTELLWITDVYGFVANHFSGHSPSTAREFQYRLGQVPVDPATLGEQLSFF